MGRHRNVRSADVRMGHASRLIAHDSPGVTEEPPSVISQLLLVEHRGRQVEVGDELDEQGADRVSRSVMMRRTVASS